MRNTPCECPAAGWCERHQCLKSEPLFQLCRRNQTVFRAWEDGQGPGQSTPEDDAEPASSSEMPGLARRIVNVGIASVRHAMSGFERTPPEVQEVRLSICRECPSCDIARMICREKTCGCYLKFKVGWASEACPIGNWGAAERRREEIGESGKPPQAVR